MEVLNKIFKEFGIEREIGNNLFYLTSLCNALNINLYDVLLKESDKMNTLGKFTFR